MKKMLLTLTLATLLPQLSLAQKTIPPFVHMITGPAITHNLKCNSGPKVRNSLSKVSLKVINQTGPLQVKIIEASVIITSASKTSEIKLRQDYQAAYNAIFSEKKIRAELDKYPLSAKLDFFGSEYTCQK